MSVQFLFGSTFLHHAAFSARSLIRPLWTHYLAYSTRYFILFSYSPILYICIFWFSFSLLFRTFNMRLTVVAMFSCQSNTHTRININWGICVSGKLFTLFSRSFHVLELSWHFHVLCGSSHDCRSLDIRLYAAYGSAAAAPLFFRQPLSVCYYRLFRLVSLYKYSSCFRHCFGVFFFFFYRFVIVCTPIFDLILYLFIK